MQRALLLGSMILALAVPAIAANAPVTLVFEGGTTLEAAEARIQQGYVYVTFADGRMQAFPTSDVDLVASGLVKAEPSGAEAAPEQPVRPQGLAAAQAAPATGSRLEITDEDVQHVRRASGPEPAEEGADESGAEGSGGSTASLLVSGLGQELVGGVLNLSGQVTNNGGKPVTTITLEARAVDADGGTAGSGSTTISQQLDPKASVGFTMSFPVEADVANVRVRASAAVADFDFSQIEPPTSAPAEEGENRSEQ
jgi:hypothetical protein